MSLLILDNKDSFTYNIVDSLRKMGIKKIIISSNPDNEIINKAEKIIFSPGPGLPNEFPLMYQILAKYHKKKPILGICLGHQALASFFGAHLYQLIIPIHGQPHKIYLKHNKSKIFKALPKEFTVGLYHSWAVDKKSIKRPLRIDAISEYGVVMAISHRKFPLFGIQFHPESYISDYGLDLLKNFVSL